MAHRRLARILLVFLMITLLCAPAWAAPGPAPEARLFDVLARLWGTLTAAWAEHGCGLDPYGACTDHGCGIDPNGPCEPVAPHSTVDHGCMLDPNGICVPGS